MAGSAGRDPGARHGFRGAPLDGIRVLVTRAETDAGRLVGALESEGAECIAVPLIRTRPPHSWEPLDEALARLGQYDWLLFTSRNGVRAFFERWERRTARTDWPPSLRVGVVGPGTAEELERHGMSPDVVPERATGPGLFAALDRSGVQFAGRRCLFPQATVARPELSAALSEAGAIVDAVPAYRTETCWESGARLRELLERGWPDVITFTSGSAVHGCVELLEPDERRLLAGVAVAAIGPTTADVAKGRGLGVDCVADRYTIGGLVQALKTCRLKSERSANGAGRRAGGGRGPGDDEGDERRDGSVS